MTMLFGGMPARHHRRENLTLIVNRDHPDNRHADPVPWLYSLGVRLRRMAFERTPTRIEYQRAQIRLQRHEMQKLLDIARRDQADAARLVSCCEHSLRQLDIEDQLLDTPR